eukprot:6434459-Amphidinium_carterae.1
MEQQTERPETKHVPIRVGTVSNKLHFKIGLTQFEQTVETLLKAKPITVITTKANEVDLATIMWGKGNWLVRGLNAWAMASKQ